MADAISYQDAAAEMQGHMQFVADQIGGDWQRLARKLKIADCVIDNVEADYRRTGEKAYQVLKKWYQYYGQAIATIETLIEALREIGKTSIAEELKIKTGGNTEPMPNDSSANSHQSPIPESHDHTSHTTNGCRLAIAMVRSYKILQDVQELNIILKQSKDSDDAENTTAMPMEEIQECCGKMCKQIDETMRLILQRFSVSDTKSEENKPPRPVSDVLPGSEKLVDHEKLEKSLSVGSKPKSNTTSRVSLLILSREALISFFKSVEPAMYTVTVPPESLIKIFDEGLTAMLRKCTDNLSTCDSPAKMEQDVQQVQKLNEVLRNMIESQKSNSDDGTEMENIKESCKIRHKQAEQTLRLIEFQMLSDSSKNHKGPNPKHHSIGRCESCGGSCKSNLQAAEPDSAGTATEHEQPSLLFDENCNQTIQPGPEEVRTRKKYLKTRV